MIDRAITQIAAQLNEYLGGLLGTSEDIVLVSNLLGPDGSAAPHVNNRIILFLTSIEKDVVSQRAPEAKSGAFSGSQPLFLNIYMMAAANFTGANYPESLKFLSLIISYFHRQPVIDHANSPGLDERIHKLVLDIENTPPQAMSNIWGVLGGRYLPSVLYRVRMVALGGGDIQGRVARITAPDATASHGAGGGHERLP